MAKKIGLILGPVLFLIFYNLPFEMLNAEADKVIAVALWMITWWISFGRDYGYESRICQLRTSDCVFIFRWICHGIGIGEGEFA